MILGVFLTGTGIGKFAFESAANGREFRNIEIPVPWGIIAGKLLWLRREFFIYPFQPFISDFLNFSFGFAYSWIRITLRYSYFTQ